MLGTAGLLTFSGSSAGAQTTEGAEQLRDAFGMPNFRTQSPNLQFLKHAQEQRLSAPRELGAFQGYLTRRRGGTQYCIQYFSS
jgi:hypothetical protein